MELRFDTYYNNEELFARLEWLAAEFPQIVELSELGRTFEGRTIPLLIITNRESGPDHEKPGFWIDGNIHATEVTASMAALYFINKVVTGYGEDPQITRLLDQQVFYVVPRLNPDGAALALADQPVYLRSGTRPYPFEEKQPGLHPEDVDGDGRVLQMRILDPAGDWKISERDPRLMVKRGPDEHGGEYYRLFPEGTIEAYDGQLIEGARPLQGLDFNRNFPGSWRPEGEQSGAGEYPGSEPEIRAVMSFFASHPNIFGAITYHTYSRAILRPFGGKADEEMDTNDRWVYELIGERGTDLTGYPTVSVFHYFKYHPKEVITGVFDDWLYDFKGIFAFTVELWDLGIAAGIESKIKDKRWIQWFRKHPVEDDYKILDFVNVHAPDQLVPWEPWEHPQLGMVELGGWNFMYTWRNPPAHLLEAEIRPQADFALAFAAMAPHLAWRTVEVTPLGDERYHLLAVLENQGFLGSYGANQAKKMKAARELRVELEIPEGATLTSGKAKQKVGHLEGRSNKLSVSSAWSLSATDNRVRVEWLVHAPGGGAVTLTAHGQRAGTVRRVVELSDAG